MKTEYGGKYAGLATVKKGRSVTATPNLPVEASTEPKRGRPKGTGTSPDAAPVTIHLSKEVYKQARIAMLQRDDERPFSKLVEDLLQTWLNNPDA